MLSCSEDSQTGHLHDEPNLYVHANNVHYDNDVGCICEDLRTNVFNAPQQPQPQSTPPSVPSSSSQSEDLRTNVFNAPQQPQSTPPSVPSSPSQSEPATPYSPPLTRASSFRLDSFQGIQFPKASKGRGRPPTKGKGKKRVEPPRDFIEDDSDDGLDDVFGISDPVFTGKRKQAKKAPSKRGRPRGSTTARRPGGSTPAQRGPKRAGPGRPPLRGADVIKRGKATYGKHANVNLPCHLCQQPIAQDDEDVCICGCFERVHDDCYRMDGCE